MNVLLGIQKDKDIAAIGSSTLATPEDVKAFMEGGAPPSLDPLLVFWDKTNSLWNNHLATAFANDFVIEHPEYERNIPDISGFFIQRIETLRKTLIKSIARTNETEAQTLDRLLGERRMRLTKKRIHSRKSRVSHIPSLSSIF
jgi:hypothetical protein